MRGLIQRVARASVRVGDETVGAVSAGLCVFVGVGHDDGLEDARVLSERICNLRIFDDGDGRPNLSLLETGGALLVVSQFTLLANTRRGRRPSYVDAARPEYAAPLVEAVMANARAIGVEVAGGRFGSRMHIDLLADGPYTLMLDTHESRRG